ncbi:transposable element Tc1 transposase [Trichonephila clavipes]|nr:transposable element Tc1 transposase [Trichonephila clavipes]
MPHSRIRAHYEQLSEFERGRIIGLKEAGWENWRITHLLGRRDELWSAGAIPFDSWTPLVIIRGTLTAKRYVDNILRTVLLPFLLQYPGFIFQQDNARPHTARVAMNCLTACQTLPWSGKSPDLFSIEHVWDIRVRRLHLSGNVDDLVRQLEQIWQEISQETIIRMLYHSMPSRVAACIQTRGGSTPY